MGCAHSQANQNLFKCLNDQNLSLPLKKQFKVVNIDDYGNKIKKGNIEVTSTELIFNSKNKSTRWLLKYLRKYAYDENLFYFESGRRGATGEGIFCFITSEAEVIFKTVKLAAENCGNFESIGISQATNFLKNDSNDSNNATIKTNDTNEEFDNSQLIKNYVNGNVINDIASNQQSILNSNHEYANLYNNNLNIQKELDLINLNKNYVNCADVKDFKNLHFKNKNNLNLKLNRNQFNDLESNEQEFNNNNENNCDDFNVTYTTLALIDKNSISDLAVINQSFIDSNTNISTPQSPNSKQLILNDFKTKSEPNSPIESEFKTQQYSLIDFDKTKALKDVIDKK